MAGTPLTGKAGWLTGLTHWLLVGLQVCPKLQVQVLQVYVSLGLTGLTGWWGVDSPCSRPTMGVMGHTHGYPTPTRVPPNYFGSKPSAKRDIARYG